MTLCEGLMFLPVCPYLIISVALCIAAVYSEHMCKERWLNLHGPVYVTRNYCEIRYTSRFRYRRGRI